MMKSIRDLEILISRLLTSGVFLSVLFISVGVGLYFAQTGGLNLVLSDDWVLKGKTLFDVFGRLFSRSNLSYALMSIGILFLMLTQYIRVVMSVIYFVFIRDWRYVVITLVVLVILTLSLLSVLRMS